MESLAVAPSGGSLIAGMERVAVIDRVESASTTLYVSLNGSDSASGTASHPFRTLAACAAAAAAGGECRLAPGRYDGPQDQRTVVVSRDLTITGPGKGPAAIIDGSVPILTAWTRIPGRSCLYQSAPMAQEVWQLWAGDSPLTPARFPNAMLADDSVFDGAPFALSGRRNGSLLYSSRDSVAGRIHDDGTHAPSLASSGLDLKGSIAVLPLGTMGSQAQGVRVTKHGANSSSFSYAPPPGTAGKGHTNLPIFFEGSCSLLDSEGEWCVARQGGISRLQVWLDGCADPRTASLRGKTRSYLLNATRATRLSLSHVTLYAGTLGTTEAAWWLSMDHVRMAFPSANRRVLDEEGATAAPLVLRANEAGGGLTLANCSFEWWDAIVPFDVVGDGARVSDCSFVRGGYALGESASLSDGGRSDGLVFERNEVTIFNSFVGLTPGTHALVEYNEFSRQTPCVDGAAVHVHIAAQNGLLLRRNWAHDLTVKAFRFDRVNSKSAKWGVNGTAVENVAWRTAGPTFKGDHHTIANNTVFDSSTESGPDANAALFVMMYSPGKPWAIPGENAHTVLALNAADSLNLP